MSGKSALRKKRFTVSRPQGSSGIPSFRSRKPLQVLHAFGQQLLAQDAHVREIAVALGEVEPVADHESIRDLEADPANGHVDLPPGRLRQQRTDLQRLRLARLQVPLQIPERE